MAKTSWVLSSIERDLHVDRFDIDDDDVKGTPDGWSVRKRTLRGGRRDGVDVIEIDNGAIEVTLIPSRGMGVWQAITGKERLGWQAPIRGPVHPRVVDLGEPGGLGWLDGFDELLVRCGLESNGAPEFDDDGAKRKFLKREFQMELYSKPAGKTGEYTSQEVSIGI